MDYKKLTKISDATINRRLAQEAANAAFCDIDDILYEKASNMAPGDIESAIGATTDYEAYADVKAGSINLQDRYGDNDTDVKEFGTDMGSYFIGDKTIAEIIEDIRSAKKSDIYRGKFA